MSVFAQVVNNTLAQLFARFGSIVISVVLTGILYRIFREEGFGAYSFISAFVLLFGHISDWGTNIITVREASKDKLRQPVIFGTTIILRLFLALVSFLAVNLVIRINPSWHDLVAPTTVASFVLIFLSFKTSAAMIFQTISKLRLAALVDFIASLAFLLLVIVSIYFYQNNLSALMFSWFLATVISGFFGILLAIKFAKVVWTFDVKIAKKIFTEAIPTGALLIVFSLYNRVDIIILQYFHGSREVAPYALSYKIFDNVVIGAAFLMNSLFPHLSREFAKNSHDGLKIYFQKAFDLLFFGATILLAFLLLFAPLLVEVLAGDPSQNVVSLIRILSLAVFIAYLNHLSGFSLIAAGLQKSSLLIAVVALIFNVAANILLVPTYSYFASAWLTVATEALVLLISFFVIWRNVGILPTFTSFPKTLIELFKK